MTILFDRNDFFTELAWVNVDEMTDPSFLLRSVASHTLSRSSSPFRVAFAPGGQLETKMEIHGRIERKLRKDAGGKWLPERGEGER